ncbi:universal stress protein UspE [Flavobacterium sp. W21_SRS_FM6]|uniref:universal stress protein UspE n=1 Tax=Flavobacterium sp. W21_SRS_FM6 TaxID=3240268 RepID=UPI003F919594
MNFKKILAVIDSNTEQQKSLSRALEISEKTGASVTAFLNIYDFSYEMTTMLSMDERENMRQAVVDDRTEWLTNVIKEAFSETDHKIDIKVVWHNRPYESIIYEVIEKGYDLIVKGTQQHSLLESVIFTPTDWHIMRKAPVPVLLVKEHDWPMGGKIIAALNLGSDIEEHQSLNQQITKHALHFTKLLGSELHLVNAYPGTPTNIVIEIPEFDPTQYNQTIRQHHIDAMQNHAQQHHISPAQCHIDEGLPEYVIPHCAEQLDAELVVLGTVGRQGISAALIGNTAEHVIDKLNCDVLAIKPEGFVSPIRI